MRRAELVGAHGARTLSGDGDPYAPAPTPRLASRPLAQGTGFWMRLGSIFSTLVLSRGLALEAKITFPRSL